jgi:uncharacterized protein (TIRG00374 family)
MKEDKGARKRGKASVTLLLRGLSAVILLAILFQFVSFRDVWQAFLAAKPAFIVAAGMLMLANIGLQLLKWRYFVRLVEPAATNLETVASLLFGITLGTLTPGQIGEFGGRAIRHRSVPAGTIVGLTLVDKVQMLCIMGIAGVISLVILFQLGGILGTVVAATAVILFTFLFFRLGALHDVISGFKTRFASRPVVQDFLSALVIFKTRDLIVSFCLSTGFYAVVYAQMFCLLSAFSPVRADDAFLGFAAMMFVKSLVPISLGDLGIREAGSVYFYAIRGIAAATALNAALLLFTINILVPSLVGLFFIPKPRTDD